MRITELGPADRAPRPIGQPRLGETQNGPLAHNLSMQSRAGAQMALQKQRRPSPDDRPYMGIFELANARLNERANDWANGRIEIWIIDRIYSSKAPTTHLETARKVRARTA